MDFFTRMITVNSLGPNMVPGTSIDGPKKVYICGRCYETHDDEADAEECCPPQVLEEWECPTCQKSHVKLANAESCCGCARGQPMQCPICLQMAESYEIAADCCLHTHPTMTLRGRQRVAEAVEKGTPWLDAVQANINH